MEINIEVNKKNKELVFKLLSQLIDAEDTEGRMKEKSLEGALDVDLFKKQGQKYVSGQNSRKMQDYSVDYSQFLKYTKPLPVGFLHKPKITQSAVGTWFMFNSFLVGKALLRVLSAMLLQRTEPNEANPATVSVTDLLETSYSAFKTANLLGYRGFPKEKEGHKYAGSNVKKLRYFVIAPLEEMGFVTIENINDEEFVGMTRYGDELNILKNPILEGLETQHDRYLSDEEIDYLLNYLKKIDSEGYKEYSLLKDFYAYLRDGNRTHTDLENWFKANTKIINYLYKGSRSEQSGKDTDSKEFKEQLKHAAAAFVSGKVALLRELKLITNERGKYNTVREFV